MTGGSNDSITTANNNSSSNNNNSSVAAINGGLIVAANTPTTATPLVPVAASGNGNSGVGGGGSGGGGHHTSNSNNSITSNHHHHHHGGHPQQLSSWLELESDPGLFTLLVDDFGVKGVQVEEIYDLSKPLDNSTYGFIFLFKWKDRRANSGLGGSGSSGSSGSGHQGPGRRSKSQAVETSSSYVTDAEIVNNMFFAHQIVPNSCATHALLSILLNCQSIDLGSILTRFKRSCEGLTPDSKGLAIGSQPRLAHAHNSYARPDPSVRPHHHKSSSGGVNSGNGATSSSIASSSSSSSTMTTMMTTTTTTTTTTITTAGINSMGQQPGVSTSGSSIAPAPTLIQQSQPDLFHFVCFVPINGRLYELDGLKPYPVDHGPCTAPSLDVLAPSVASDALNGGGDSGMLSGMLSGVLASSLNGMTASASFELAASLNWTAKFKQIIVNRLNSFNSGHNNHEIRFNLMAVVPDRMVLLKNEIDLIIENRQRIQKLLVHLETISATTSADPTPTTFTLLDKSLSCGDLTNSQVATPLTSLINTSTPTPIPITTATTTTTTTTTTTAQIVTEDSNSVPSHPNSESNNVNNNSTTSTSTPSSEQRQLRSALRRSNTIQQQLKNQQQPQQQQQHQKPIDVAFKTSSNSMVHDFLKKMSSSTFASSGDSSSSVRVKILNRLKNELSRMLDKMDLVDACKLFQLDPTPPTPPQPPTTTTSLSTTTTTTAQSPSSAITTTTTTTTVPPPSTTSNETSVEEMFTLRKSTSLNELRNVEVRLKTEAESDEVRLSDEADKRKKYQIDALRRKHIYDEFIVTYLKILAESGKLEEIIRNSVLPDAQQNNFNLTANTLFLQPPVTKKQRKK